MAEPWGGIAAILAFVIGGPAAFWFAGKPHFERRLENNARYRRRWIAELRHPTVGRLYEGLLDSGLRRLDRLMGPLDWRHLPQAFGVCLVLALAYSFLFLVLGWAVFGWTGQVGSTEFLPDWFAGFRKLFAIGVLLYGVYAYYFLRWADHQGRWWIFLLALVTIALAAAAPALAGAENVAVALILAAGVAVAIVVGVAVALALAAALALSGLFSILAFAALLMAFFIVRKGGLDERFEYAAILGLAAIAIAVAAFLGGDGDARTFLLWALLPFANMLWDAPSWLASRWLGGHLLAIVRDRGRPVRSKVLPVIAHVAADLMLAGLFLVLLAATLPPLVEAFNASTAARIGEAPFPLTATGDGDVGYLCTVARDPWGEGSWAMLMLVSTLVPTALHALMALAALLAVPVIALQGSADLARSLRRHVPKSYPNPGAELGGDGRRAIDDAAVHLTGTWLGVWFGIAILMGGGGWLWHTWEPALPDWLAAGIEMFREFLLGIALWDLAAARDCLSVGPASTAPPA